LNPVCIIFNGAQPDQLTALLYNQYLISLTASGGSFTGSYTDDAGNRVAVTVTINTKRYSPTVAGRWLSIKDQGKTYDYLFDIQVLDSQAPTTCPDQASALETMKLNYWKQCAWKLNAVIDSRGLARLINNAPAAQNLAPVDISMVKQLPDNQDARNIVQSSLSRIYYDAQHNRYLVLLNQEQDQGWEYYAPKYNNWYVDISNGVIFDPTVATVGAFARTSLLASQLDTLLARLGVGVTEIQDAAGQPAYDDFGRPLTVDGKQIRTKLALVYRGGIHQAAKTNRAVKARRVMRRR
jgi:hypothetical protein